MKIQLVPNWRHLWKAASIQILAVGAVLPEILQIVADNTALIPWLDEAFLSTVRPSFVQVVVTLLIAGTYAVVLQHHLAKHWLRADH